jgi:hypothetical protein
MVDYKKNVDLDDDMLDSSPLKLPNKGRPDESASDIDFAAGDTDGDDDSDGGEMVDPRELQPPQERSRSSITTPPKGKSPVKKVTSSQPKGSSLKKPATVIPIKKQQVSAKKISVPPKVLNKSTHTAPASSNKTVGSKKPEKVNAQNLPQKIKNGEKVKPGIPAKSSEVKEKAPTANSIPKPAASKGTKIMQPKKQEATPIKQIVPSASSAANNTNLGNRKTKPLPAKPANAVKVNPSLSEHSVPAKTLHISANVKPDAAPKTASAVDKRPVASETTTAPQTSKKARGFANSPITKSNISNPAAPSLLKTTLQIANSQPQNIDQTPQITAHNSIEPSKKDPVNPSLDSGTLQTSISTSLLATNSVPIQGLGPMKMDLDNSLGQMQIQSTKMDLDNDPDQVQPRANKMDLANMSKTSEAAPRLILRFSLPSKMGELATKLKQSISATTAKPDTLPDSAHCK